MCSTIDSNDYEDYDDLNAEDIDSFKIGLFASDLTQFHEDC